MRRKSMTQIGLFMMVVARTLTAARACGLNLTQSN